MSDEQMTRAASEPGAPSSGPHSVTTAARDAAGHVAPATDGTIAVQGGPGQDGQGDQGQDAPQKRRGGWLAGIGEFVIAFAIMALVIWLVRLFIVEPFTIPTRSMVPTIVPDDSVYAEKITIKGSDFTPTPGQVYTFINPEDPSETLIKRVIATEGQVIDLRDGDVYVDGVKLDEPYTHGQRTDPMRSTAGVTYPYTIPEGCFWAMGDNRGNSGDSRVFGAVPVDSITGHAVFRYWPIFRNVEGEGWQFNLGPLDYTGKDDNPQKNLPAAGESSASGDNE